jgi:hypothetical protein
MPRNEKNDLGLTNTVYPLLFFALPHPRLRSSLITSDSMLMFGRGRNGFLVHIVLFTSSFELASGFALSF